jgi:hypothetical protein
MRRSLSTSAERAREPRPENRNGAPHDEKGHSASRPASSTAMAQPNRSAKRSPARWGRWRESASQSPDYGAGARPPEQHRHGRSTWSRTRIGRRMRPSGSPSPPAARRTESPEGDRADSNRRSPGPRPGVHSVWTAVTANGRRQARRSPVLRGLPGIRPGRPALSGRCRPSWLEACRGHGRC